MHLAGNQTAGDQATLSWDRERSVMREGGPGAQRKNPKAWDFRDLED